VKRQDAAGNEVDAKIPMIRTYTVFNADQIEGLPERFIPAMPAPIAPTARSTPAELALLSSGAEVRHGGTRAYYSPGHDFVQMPEFERFEDGGAYLATLAHELCHWTGHKGRLDRSQANKFGSKDYAAEELVAEIGAAFVGARLGIVGEHIENHAAYVASWLKVLKDDKRAIFKAASAAQLAADLVLANAADMPEPDGEPDEAPEAPEALSPGAAGPVPAAPGERASK
jgi:antirestriction protein ArdC